MKRLLVVILLLLITGGAFLLAREERGPMPSHRSLANYGFAVWPADTIEEGIEECRDADPWRLNPSATARSFARDVLNYPAPTVDDVTPARDHVRYLINSRESRGIFLGSVIDLRRYGHCWYVTQGQPREGDLTREYRIRRRPR